MSTQASSSVRSMSALLPTHITRRPGSSYSADNVPVLSDTPSAQLIQKLDTTTKAFQDRVDLLATKSGEDRQKAQRHLQAWATKAKEVSDALKVSHDREKATRDAVESARTSRKTLRSTIRDWRRKIFKSKDRSSLHSGSDS